MCPEWTVNDVPGMYPCGGGRRIRTFEDVSRQIYSLMRLATSLSHRRLPGEFVPDGAKGGLFTVIVDGWQQGKEMGGRGPRSGVIAR